VIGKAKIVGGVLCVAMAAFGLDVNTAGPEVVDSAMVDTNCETYGCIARNEVSSNTEGGANTCGITVTVDITAIPDTNVDGRCICDKGACVAVGSRECRANAVATVTVTANSSAYVFCSNQTWQTVGNVAIIELDSGTKKCTESGEWKSEAGMFVQCGTSCGSLTGGSSAVVITFKSTCWGCQEYDGC
jgi:hypothetical protein